MFHSITSSARIALVVAMPLAVPVVAAAQQAPATLSSSDSALLAHVAVMARQRSTALMGDRAGNAATAAQYREALADIDRGALPDAMTGLTAALARARDNALFRGELAYVHARLGHLDDAMTEYTRAYQALQRNAWYLVGAAAIQAAKGAFPEAAGTMQLAASNDSNVVDSVTAGPTALWFSRTTDRTAALTWSRIATQKNPRDADAWLVLSTVLAQRGDTSGESGTAIRHYFELRHDNIEPLGYALLANDVFGSGNLDSAIVLMGRAASRDSSYREFLGRYYLAAAGRVLGRGAADSALGLLGVSRPLLSRSRDSTTVTYLTGRAQLAKAQVVLRGVETSHACDDAHAADSLITAADNNIRQGRMADSTRADMFLANIVPGFKQNAQAAVASCRQPGATPARGTRPAPAPAPARRPARRP